MDLFNVTEFVRATPMTRAAYNEYRGWKLPEDENGEDDGYLIERANSDVQNHPDHKGYISWTPKELFDRCYTSEATMDFGKAVKALKAGEKVARTGWNGKGMYVYFVPENRYAPTTDAGRAIAANHEDGLVPYRAYIAIKSVDGEVVPWVASQTDILAEDWMIAEETANG